ncbi:MAG: branched-chain amino acid transport system ATP-binding protein [Actinomycetota bacterium]|jgi:ABC-type branched-subunit amino acid transport system ATPase component/ABC-type branched-subunit amino acid transport system permease subunit|nr:branched-chain amino acid transport system ATP-binding protein [Actinomycetota bacterium]
MTANLGRAARTRRYASLAVVGVGLVAWPFLGAPFSLLGDAIQACLILMVTVSLVLLIGWVGQISLAQAAFVGIGAFSTGVMARRWHIPFPLSLLVAGSIAAAVAAGVGMIALRVRGLYLAVATLIFGWVADEYLFRSTWLVGVGGSSTISATGIGRRGALPYFDLSERRTFYFVVLAAAAASLYAASNLRDSRTGRAFFAVRGSEIAAASLGIDVRRYKLTAFAISGFLAGAAGNLVIVGQRTAVPAQFNFTFSLFYLAVAVVGGLTSLGGAVAAAILFAALSELFYRVRALAGWLEVVSAVLLAVVLLTYPGGLAAVPHSLRRPMSALRRRLAPAGRLLKPATAPVARLVRRAWSAIVARANEYLPDRSIDDAEFRMRFGPIAMNASTKTLVPAVPRGPLPSLREERRPILEAENITVQFGGLTAVGGVSLSVREGEIVGLIGPNGAGKTTTFNAISGLNEPTSGTVKLFGQDVTDQPVHKRAALGVARTFQVIQLFNQLTVFDNLLVATHGRGKGGVRDHLFVTRRCLDEEYDARMHVREVIAAMELEEISDRRVAGLPFGVLRLIELARAVVTGAPLIMLDEPASGLDNAETDRFAERLFQLRANMGVSILLIEHDVRLVTSVSDYMYVIDRGRPLAEGEPHDVGSNEAVIAAYLGQATAKAVDA